MTTDLTLRAPATAEERIDCALRCCAAMTPDARIRLCVSAGRRRPGRPAWWTLTGVRDGHGRTPRTEAHTLDEALAWANGILAVATRPAR